jgi:hypothetical protein
MGGFAAIESAKPVASGQGSPDKAEPEPRCAAAPRHHSQGLFAACKSMLSVFLK